ncbi:ABC transporter ATP-binding protein [Paenibacillus dendritiformis]|nr:ABC transporter ATP-binding protein [Paenibacillus dendritiformis]
MIHIENMSKAYRMGGEEMLSLNEVSLTVYAGEMMAIIGPSGSGKSTLMNMMGCLDTPTSGTYWLDGQEVSKLSGNQLADIRNRKIGFIFQSFYLLPALTAMENVELPLIYRGMPAKKRHELAVQALTQVGLESKLNFLPRQLSGGQQQRVAIARALVGEPPVILADEPTGALDTKTGLEVLAMMKDLNRKGHTIVLITHDPDVAEEAGSVVRIQDGRIQVVRRFAP